MPRPQVREGHIEELYVPQCGLHGLRRQLWSVPAAVPLGPG